MINNLCYILLGFIGDSVTMYFIMKRTVNNLIAIIRAFHPSYYTSHHW